MGSKSQVLLNPQALFEDHQDHEVATNSQLGFFNFPSNLTFFQLPSIPQTHSPSPPFDPPNFSTSNTNNNNNSNNLSQTLISSSLLPLKPSISYDFAPQHLLSLQTSTPNLWPWGEIGERLMNGKRSNNENHQLGVSKMKMKKMKGRRKVREPRFSFKTMSDVDVLDDGYKWRKYGQKVVKNTQHPRSYYRCTQDHCRVKKRVERLAEDPRMVITTYEGRHVHSPSHDSEDSEAQTHLNNFFW
ncbi:probable WRKY transcription factor 13 [Benincasa hispida]|uniref:probable WRKY transcription factor 13 n=1 Tax=Benincasa hispida TaxID=102211 RepID=UPI001900EB36|nr:probable WRKY transcription factor 13 [Benincasa hispida]